MKKTVLALFLLVGMSSTASVFAILPQSARIGTNATYVLLSSKDARGDFIGFDIDPGDELCFRIKVKCIWVGSDFDSLIPFLKAERVGAITSSLSITEKCQQEIAFSDKLYVADPRLIAVKGLPVQPTLEALRGKHVGVPQGPTQEAYVNDRWRSQGVGVVAYQNQDLIYPDLAAGCLDAVLQDEAAASGGLLGQPTGRGFALAGPSVRDKKYFGDGTGTDLHKDDVELKAAFGKALGEIRKDDTYDKMTKKYLDFNICGD